jgi:hypothetical protein
MSEQEKMALAEEFVRNAVRHLSISAKEEDIKQAAKKAAKSLPPYHSKDKKEAKKAA